MPSNNAAQDGGQIPNEEDRTLTNLTSNTRQNLLLLRSARERCKRLAAGCKGVARLLPSVHYIRTYELRNLPLDLAAGFSVGVSAIPMGMSYALLADLPPTHGLYSNMIYCLVYMILGTCRQCAVGTSAIEAMMAGEAIARLVGDPHARLERRLEALAILSFFVGIVFLVFRAVRMGRLVSRFLSEPVLNGLSTGAAINIALAQLSSLLGIPKLPQSEVGIKGRWLGVWSTILRFRSTNGWCFCVSVSTILMLSIIKLCQSTWDLHLQASSGDSRSGPFHRDVPTDNGILAENGEPPLPVSSCHLVSARRRRWRRRMRWLSRPLRNLLYLPGPLIVLICFVICGQLLSLDQYVPVVGNIASGLPSPSFPLRAAAAAGGSVGIHFCLSAFCEALWYALVVFAIHLAVTQSFAAKEGYPAHPCQECIALGVAGTVGSAFGCLPIATSISRSAIAYTAGAQTPLFHASNVLCLVIAATVLGPCLRVLPLSCLAAVVVFSVRKMAHPGRPMTLLRHGYHSDAFVWVAAAVATLIGGALYGLLAGVLTAFVCLIRRSAYPLVTSTEIETSVQDEVAATDMALALANAANSKLLRRSDADSNTEQTTLSTSTLASTASADKAPRPPSLAPTEEGRHHSRGPHSPPLDPPSGCRGGGPVGLCGGRFALSPPVRSPPDKRKASKSPVPMLQTDEGAVDGVNTCFSASLPRRSDRTCHCSKPEDQAEASASLLRTVSASAASQSVCQRFRGGGIPASDYKPASTTDSGAVVELVCPAAFSSTVRYAADGSSRFLIPTNSCDERDSGDERDEPGEAKRDSETIVDVFSPPQMTQIVTTQSGQVVSASGHEEEISLPPPPPALILRVFLLRVEAPLTFCNVGSLEVHVDRILERVTAENRTVERPADVEESTVPPPSAGNKWVQIARWGRSLLPRSTKTAPAFKGTGPAVQVRAAVVLEGIDGAYDVTVAQAVWRLSQKLEARGHAFLLVSPQCASSTGDMVTRNRRKQCIGGLLTTGYCHSTLVDAISAAKTLLLHRGALAVAASANTQ